MKKHPGWILLILLIFALAACQTQTTPAPPADSGDSGETAAQETTAPEAYPEPQSVVVEPTDTPPPVLYPDSQSGDTVRWTQAAAMIVNGEVSEIRKMDELQLTLVLKDGRTLLTSQRSRADVDQLLKDCGEVCGGITVTGP